MKSIAVTGSSGFVGKHLIKDLKKNNNNVIELDINTGFDLCNTNDIRHIPKFDVLIHLAAKSFVPHSFEKPYDFYFQNYIMTLNMLEAARNYNARVIFISSYLYGDPEYLPINESHFLKPHNPYAQSKLICEKLCEGYNRDFNIPVTILRPFNIYGPDQKESFLIPSIIKQIKSGIINLNDPRPKRDFIHVFDIVSAIKKAVYHITSNLEIYNLGSGESYSIQEVIMILQDCLKTDVKVNFSNEIRNGEILNTIADITKAKSLLEWTPQISIYDGLIELIDK